MLVYNKRMTFVNSRKYREFETLNFNINIPPNYNDNDFFNFKAGSKHYKNKIGFNSNNKGRTPKKIGL